jgi:hypothetical protein
MVEIGELFGKAITARVDAGRICIEIESKEILADIYEDQGDGKISIVVYSRNDTILRSNLPCEEI